MTKNPYSNWCLISLLFHWLKSIHTERLLGSERTLHDQKRAEMICLPEVSREKRQKHQDYFISHWLRAELLSFAKQSIQNFLYWYAYFLKLSVGVSDLRFKRSVNTLKQDLCGDESDIRSSAQDVIAAVDGSMDHYVSTMYFPIGVFPKWKVLAHCLHTCAPSARSRVSIPLYYWDYCNQNWTEE